MSSTTKETKTQGRSVEELADLARRMRREIIEMTTQAEADAAIRALNADYGLTVFLVEQSAYHALKLADRGYVMVNGRITMSGSGAELLGSPEVQAAYLEGGVSQQGAQR